MAIRSVSPDPTARKRPYDECFDTTETPGSKKRRKDPDQRIPGLFEKATARLPSSAFDRVQMREVGMGPFSFDPSRDIEKGKRLLAEGKMDEAQRALCIANHSALLKPNFGHLLIQIGHIEHDHQLYSDSLATFQLLAQNAPSYRELAHLCSSLCHFYLGKRADFRLLLSHFAEEWVKWILLTPSLCPLSPEEYALYSRTIDQCIPRLKEIQEQVGLEREEGLDPVALEELDHSILMALFYLGLAQNNLDEVAQALDELGLDESAILVLIYDLKSFDPERKNRAFERAKDMRIRWEMGIFEELISIKLLFSEGLKSKDPRPLECARRNFLVLEAQTQEQESNIKMQIKTWIFFCHLALEQYKQALEVAYTIELLQPGSAAMLSTLCRLHQAETVTQDIIEDLKKSLERKDKHIAEPSMLQFIGDFIMEKVMHFSLLPDPGLAPALIPISKEFYRGASSFHGQRDSNEIALDFFWSQVRKFRDLYRQNQFEAALILGQKLCKGSINNDFILVEVALCLFQLRRSPEAVQLLREILDNKIDSEDNDLPYVDEERLAECIPWLRSAREEPLAQEYEKWVQEFPNSEPEESLEEASND